MSQNLQSFVKFQKFQLENLVDFEKCCNTHIFLQKSVPIQPKTSNILPIGRRVADRCFSAGARTSTSPGPSLALLDSCPEVTQSVSGKGLSHTLQFQNSEMLIRPGSLELREGAMPFSLFLESLQPASFDTLRRNPRATERLFAHSVRSDTLELAQMVESELLMIYNYFSSTNVHQPIRVWAHVGLCVHSRTWYFEFT